MSTHSTIAIKNKDNTYTSIYCHFDGYLSHNGRILNDKYQDEDIVNELISLGDLSFIAEDIDDVVAYHRDRGEDFQQSHHNTEQELIRSSEYYLYLFKDNEWYYNDNGIFYLLKNFL